jgi:hypothetical protein
LQYRLQYWLVCEIAGCLELTDESGVAGPSW